MTTDRTIMVKPGKILAKHGSLTVDVVIDQLGSALGDTIASKDCCQVAAAVDKITVAQPR